MSLVSGLLVNQNPCSQCHGNISEYCRFNPTSSSAVLPTVVQKGSTLVTMPIEVSGSGSNIFYRIYNLKVTLKTSNNKLAIQKPVQEWSNIYPGGKIFFTTTISGIQEGTDTLIFELSAKNTHNSVTFTDSYSYNVNISMNETSVQQPAIEPSTQSLYLSKKQTTLQLMVLRDIQNLMITSSNNITVMPTTVAAAQSGEIIDVNITILRNTTLEDALVITWNERTANQQIKIFLSYVPPTPEDINYFSITGRVIGIISFILLIASICFSGINKRIRSHVNTFLNIQRRIQIHCYLSWTLLAISLIHGLVLLLGPYSNFIAKPEIILGYFTIVSMAIVSINGSFRSFIIKKIGGKLWRKTHGYYSYIALFLCILHACLIGTEFQIIRSVF